MINRATHIALVMFLSGAACIFAAVILKNINNIREILNSASRSDILAIGGIILIVISVGVFIWGLSGD